MRGMTTVRITSGARPNLDKIRVTKAIRFYASINLEEAKRHTDEMLSNRETSIVLPNRHVAEILAARLNELETTATVSD